MTNRTSQPVWDAAAIANQLQTIAGRQIGIGDASTLGSAFLDLMTQMMSNPTALANAPIDLFNDSMTVWRHAAERMFLMSESDA
jgi:polyhydroxyalkanoate synthase